MDAATAAVQDYIRRTNLASHNACPKVDSDRVLQDVLKSLGPILYLATETKPRVNPHRICVKTSKDAFSILKGNDVMFTNQQDAGVMAGANKPLVLDELKPGTQVT